MGETGLTLEGKMQFRACTPIDAPLLAPLNLQLIRDEGSRNPMDVAQLARRMYGWLQAEYRAVVFEQAGEPIGYALFRIEPDHVFLRQLFVAADHRRKGIGREAVAWLWKNVWVGAAVMRVEVVKGNPVGLAFWRAIGLVEYAVTLEGAAPPASVIAAIE
jgi:GNAT superfamily N-acetyltransferase